MKIQFDNVSTEYLYPLSSMEDIERIKAIIPPEIIESIMRIRFGCNTKTTQEARIVKRGKKFDIRINFFLRGLKSTIVSSKKQWIRIIEKFGGVVNLNEKKISWKLTDAQEYTLFLILHEIGHIVYSQKHGNGEFVGKRNRGSTMEERWCDSYALESLKKL